MIFQARECAEAMEADIYKRFQPEDEIGNIGDDLHNGNPLPNSRMSAVLDPRTKSCIWANIHEMEP